MRHRLTARWIGWSVSIHILFTIGLWLALPSGDTQGPSLPDTGVTIVALIDTGPTEVPVSERPFTSSSDAVKPFEPLREETTVLPPPVLPVTEAIPEELDYTIPTAPPSAETATDLEAVPIVDSQSVVEERQHDRVPSTSLTDGTRGTDTCGAYTDVLIARLASSPYPPLARSLGISGRVAVAYTIASDGRVTEPEIVAPSRDGELNWAAIQAVKRLGAVPREPSASPLRCTVEMEFRLNDPPPLTLRKAAHSP